MHISKAELIVDLDGFIKALKFFEENDFINLTFEHEKVASPIQTIGPPTTYQYNLIITADTLPQRNLYPILRDLEKVIDNL